MDHGTTTAPPAATANDTAVVPAVQFPKARPARAASEKRRYRATPDRAESRRGRQRDDGTAATGHPVLFDMRPAIELDIFPSGGGYPVGFVEAAAHLLEADLADIVHVCSGSVRGGRLTIDMRPEAGPDVVADARWLPLGAATVRAFLIDPPYSQDYAEDLWQLGHAYPAPIVILREVAHALEPGGRVGFLHHLVPVLPPELKQVGVYGVSTGQGYRMRAFTVAERRGQDLGATALDGIGATK